MNVHLDMLMERMTLPKMVLFVIACLMPAAIAFFFFFFFFWFLVLGFSLLGLGLLVGQFLGGLFVGHGGCDVAAVTPPQSPRLTALLSVSERPDRHFRSKPIGRSRHITRTRYPARRRDPCVTLRPQCSAR